MSDEHLLETPLDGRVVYRGSYLSLRVDRVRDAAGATHTREVVEHPGAVAIVAVDGGEVLFVRQFRHAAGQVMLEIPAGTLDRLPDGSIEPPDTAAPRELAEETGVRAARWRKIGTFWTAPGFASEEMHLYLASDLHPLEDYAGPEPDEHLELVRLPWREAVARCVRGEIHDAKTIVGLLTLARLIDAGAL